MAKRKVVKRSRSFSEKVMIVLSVIIALSMILGLVVGLTSNRGGTTTTSTSQLVPAASTLISRVVMSVTDPVQVVVLVEDLAPPGNLA